MLACH